MTLTLEKKFVLALLGAVLFTLGLVVGLMIWIQDRSIIFMITVLSALPLIWMVGRLFARHVIQPFEEITAGANRMATDLEAEVAEITEDRARLRTVLSSMVEGVLVLDRDSKILLLNSAIERMFQLEGPAAVGRPLIEVFRHHPLHRLLQKVLESEADQSDEMVIFMPEERTFTVQASVAQTGAVAVVMVFHDVTDLKRLERIRKDFVANVSHELRTPLTSIKGYIEALLDGAKDDPKKCAEFLGIIQKHADQLDALLSDLLQLSTIESGQYQWRRGPVSIGDLIGKAVHLLRPLAEKKGQAISVAPAEGVGPVIGDADKLTEVLINLIDNAIKYTPDGGRITVEVRPGESAVEIAISDTGIGISSKEIPRIFERFYRIDRARSRELGGTGLGLAIVKHIVEAHGGKVRVESRIGKGSRFVVSLPKKSSLSQSFAAS
ncbi:MAG: phosphate regulon sensor histidine kinase PhoR [Nitrospirae bacterium]|nr:phosphate regulon sensor histidine kinase PhoR [Nitrospirota bacterium]